MIAGSKADTLYMTEDAFAKSHRYEGQRTFPDRWRYPYRDVLGAQIR